MFSLIALGTGAAYLYSLFATFAPGIFRAGFHGMGGTARPQDVIVRWRSIWAREFGLCRRKRGEVRDEPERPMGNNTLINFTS